MGLVEDIMMRGLVHQLLMPNGTLRDGGIQLLWQLSQQLEQLWRQMLLLGPLGRIEILQEMLQEVADPTDALGQQ